MVDKSAERLRSALGGALPRDWRNAAPLGYASQIELAIVAAVFRGADDADIAFQVTARYMQARPGKRLNSAAELGRLPTGAIAKAVGPPFDTAAVVGAKFLRVDLAGEIAAALAARQINTADDFREAALLRPLELESAVMDVPHSGPLTYIQLATLLRADTRPGVAVADWIRGVIGDSSTSRADVHRVLQEAAVAAGSEPFVLHFALAKLVAEQAQADEESKPGAKKRPPAKKAPAKKAPAKRKPAAAKNPAPKNPAPKKAPAKKKPAAG